MATAGAVGRPVPSRADPSSLLARLGGWWMPAWLDRIIPKLNVEGSRHDGAAPQPQHPPTHEPALADA